MLFDINHVKAKTYYSPACYLTCKGLPIRWLVALQCLHAVPMVTFNHKPLVLVAKVRLCILKP